MTRAKPIHIRWPQELLDLINAARGDISFSDFVRDAARDKAVSAVHPPTPISSTLLDQASGQVRTADFSPSSEEPKTEPQS